MTPEKPDPSEKPENSGDYEENLEDDSPDVLSEYEKRIAEALEVMLAHNRNRMAGIHDAQRAKGKSRTLDALAVELRLPSNSFALLRQLQIKERRPWKIPEDNSSCDLQFTLGDGSPVTVSDTQKKVDAAREDSDDFDIDLGEEEPDEIGIDEFLGWAEQEMGERKKDSEFELALDDEGNMRPIPDGSNGQEIDSDFDLALDEDEGEVPKI